MQFEKLIKTLDELLLLQVQKQINTHTYLNEHKLEKLLDSTQRCTHQKNNDN